MRVMIVGGGAREHALALALSRSPKLTHLIAAPGNPGIAALATLHAVRADDIAGLTALAARESIDLVVVGPEAPLVLGLVDALRAVGIACYGPDRRAAELEGSKTFAKEIMEAAGVPTARARTFTDADAAIAYIEAAGRPLVVKADGLAAGKGVVVASDAATAIAAVRASMIDGVFGDAGKRVLIEDCLVGPEVSYHAICDGETFVALAPAQDHKRLGDGDAGPNTGGMGAYSPVPFVDAALEQKIIDRCVRPTLRQMVARGTPFRGTLFVGLMIEDGEPYVLEYNVRFGDPETAVLLARLDGDVLELLSRAARGELEGVTPPRALGAALAVVLAAAGYPETPVRGDVITGIDEGDAVEGVSVLHAGTSRGADGSVTTAGGRVLTVTATGSSIDEAAGRAYRACDEIAFAGRQLRRDIGWQARSSR